MSKTKEEQPKYYSLKNILAKNCVYNVIVGERSNGKTCSVLEYCLDDYFANGRQFAYIRRWGDEVMPKFLNTLFSPPHLLAKIEKLSNGEFNGIVARAGVIRFTKYDEKEQKNKATDKILGYAFSLNAQEHIKSSSYPNVGNILFDEFLTRRNYLPDEFVLFMNTISTIVRDRDDVKIFMCGNTVNQYSPYIAEMGLTNIKKQKKGTIDIYTYADCPNLSVAVEYSDFPAKTKASDKYFGFNNEKLKMITQGAWELPVAPHLPRKYNWLTDVLFKYYIIFEGEMLQCEIINVDNTMFTYIHKWTSEIDQDKELIYSPAYDVRPNWRRYITRPTDEIDKKIASFFVKRKVYYSDNTVAEVVRNYINFSRTDRDLT